MASTIKQGTIPGVYIQEVTNTALAVTEARLKVAGIVGHSSPNLDIVDLKVKRGSTTDLTDVLPYEAVNVLDIVSVSQYVGAAGTNLPAYVKGTDFTWTTGVNGNKIVWQEGTELAPTNVPVSGSYYYVTLKIKKDDSFFGVKKFNNINSVISYYGPEYYTTVVDGGNVDTLNELVVAARLAFENGANVLYLCQVSPNVTETVTDLDNIKDAIMKLDEVDVQAIVCVAHTASNLTALNTFITQRVVYDSATENQMERVGFVCAAENDVDAIKTQVASFNHEQRITLIAPSTITVTATNKAGEAKDFTVPSSFAAAAMVGKTTNNAIPVSEPLTRKELVGVKGLSENYKKQEVESLSEAGVLVLIDKSDVIKVNQAVTTDTTNQNNRELSVVLIKDEVRKDLRNLLDNYIGHAYSRKTTPTTIKSAICSYLDTKIGTLVESYNQADVIVVPDEVEATQVNVNLAFAVMRPLNYIYLSYTVVL